MIKKITLEDDAGLLCNNLERYVKVALDSGASAAAAVPTSQIAVDGRVLMKCRFPLCSEYGACINCPPNTGTIEDMRARIEAYKHAVVMKLDVPSERIAGAAARGDEGIEDLKKLCKIISDVESAAFYDGYYFATGFSSASCHFIWCRGLDCQALSGKGCRHRARAYASMEATGIDVFRLAVSLGWEIYPIGMSATADMFPHGSRYGMVLIH
jgi:predicted metal-binding protein